MHPLLTKHWSIGWDELGRSAPPDLLGQLCQAYQEPQRHYHTLKHLLHCLQEWDVVSDQAQRPGAVAVALFFHDAVYDPTDMAPHANELASARWAREALSGAGVDSARVDDVAALIMATCHDAVTTDGDQTLLVDVDLAILGQSETRFAAYEQEVRREFSWVPEEAFRNGRRRILEQFLARDAIFGTSHFNALYEQPARRNLRRSVKALSD